MANENADVLLKIALEVVNSDVEGQIKAVVASAASVTSKEFKKVANIIGAELKRIVSTPTGSKAFDALQSTQTKTNGLAGFSEQTKADVRQVQLLQAKQVQTLNLAKAEKELELATKKRTAEQEKANKMGEKVKSVSSNGTSSDATDLEKARELFYSPTRKDQVYTGTIGPEADKILAERKKSGLDFSKALETEMKQMESWKNTFYSKKGITGGTSGALYDQELKNRKQEGLDFSSELKKEMDSMRSLADATQMRLPGTNVYGTKNQPLLISEDAEKKRLEVNAKTALKIKEQNDKETQNNAE